MNQKITCFGEALWDVLPTGEKIGGAPLNVALLLKNFFEDINMISAVGNDEKGNRLIEFFENNGLQTQFVQQNDLPTSEVLVHLDETHNANYEICQPVAWDDIRIEQKMIETVKQSDCFVYGTLAARSLQTRTTLNELLKHAKLKIIDINLRAPFDTPEIVDDLLYQADIVKLNDDELKSISKRNQIEGSEKELIIWFFQKHSCKQLILTKGSKGAILYDGNDFYEHNGFQVKVKDSVGAGDAFLAGFVQALFENSPSEKKLEKANAYGAYVASKEGATPKFEQQEIEEIIDGNAD